MNKSQKDNIITNSVFQKALCCKVPTITPITAKAASFTVGLEEDGTLFEVDATGGSVTATLPAALDAKGRTYRFKYFAGANNFILDGAGAETIDGAATSSNTGTGYTEVVSNGVQWLIL